MYYQKIDADLTICDCGFVLEIDPLSNLHLMQELLTEVENSRETMIQLHQELESLQSYNSLLLAKVMEHCPQILEMKM